MTETVEAKHTPEPADPKWLVERSRHADFEYQLLRLGGPGNSYLPVASIPTRRAAELILHPVKCFDDLVTALYAIRREARKSRPNPDEIFALADAAIAKAEAR